jgi:hypothetical protein
MVMLCGDCDACLLSVPRLYADTLTYECLCGRKANSLSVHARDEDVLAMNRGSEGLCDFQSLSICIELCVCSLRHGDWIAAGLADLETLGWMSLAAISITATRSSYIDV